MLEIENTWSDWIDFNENIISDIPQSAGVYMIHASMKILLIEGASNIKKSVIEKLSFPCIANNARLRYMETFSYKNTAENLIKNYKNRHEGNLPTCMQD